MVSPDLLQPALWRGFSVNTLYTVYEDGELRPQRSSNAASVYHPSDQIPLFVFCRTSESTKRLDNGLSVVEAAMGDWGTVFEVKGGESNIGVLIGLVTGAFSSAFCTPDGVHLCRPGPPPEGSIMKEIFNYKTFRSFRFGPPGADDVPHDVMLTAKTRWFRKRNNPKFLGFSKENKT